MSSMANRVKQKTNRIKNYDNKNHHPIEKKQQLDLLDLNNKSILELFAGRGNLTEYYNLKSNNVTSLSLYDDFIKITNEFIKKNITIVKDSNIYIHELISKNKLFDHIDIDAYNDGGHLLPNIFKLANDKCSIAWTFPFLNSGQAPNIFKRNRYKTLWGLENPHEEDVIKKIQQYASLDNFKLTNTSIIKFNKIRRILLSFEKDKATTVLQTLKDI